MRKQELHPRTAVINQKQKNLSKKARLEALSWLAVTFPHAFDNKVRIRPLSVGIMADILAHADKALAAGISVSKLRQAVVLFTRRIDYLICLKSREMRIDLEGNPVVAVTEAEAAVAAAKIKKRVEKSAKSAKKSLATPSPRIKRPSADYHHTTLTAPITTEFVPYYPERAPAFSVQNSLGQPVRATSVTVKHKQTRAYDPDAVARLKEKLGLSRKDSDASDRP
jgi:ProP effector